MARSEQLVDAGQSLFDVSDRKEKVKEFFQRNRVVVGGISKKELITLSGAKKPIENLLLHYTSANGDPAKSGLFGDVFTLAPLRPEVAALIEKQTG